MQLDMTAFFEQVDKEIKLADLTRALMSRVREAHESDRQTLRRVVDEYKACKYKGKPIPGGKALVRDESPHQEDKPGKYETPEGEQYTVNNTGKVVPYKEK